MLRMKLIIKLLRIKIFNILIGSTENIWSRLNWYFYLFIFLEINGIKIEINLSKNPEKVGICFIKK
jgi:hypothetical protein